MSILILLLQLLFLLALLWWIFKAYTFKKNVYKFKGPSNYPFIGNAHRVKSYTDVIPVISSMFNKYGKVFKIMVGYHRRLFVADSKFAEFLLESSTILEKSYEYNFFHAWLGMGLLTSSESAMGVSMDSQNDANTDYVESVQEMCRIINDRSFSVIKQVSFLYKLTKEYDLEQKFLKIMHGFTDNVIRKRQQEIEMQRSLNPEDSHDPKKKLAFLDLLLHCKIDGEPLSNKDIADEVNTFMFEGHDTTTSAICFTLYCLALYQDVQEKVLQELYDILGEDKEKSLTLIDLQSMEYLNNVIKESMRIYPPVPIYGRTLESDIEYDGQLLQKGLFITIFPYSLHRDATYFPNPEQFIPERFTKVNSQSRSPFAYLPFSAGMRNCIGQRFAMLEIKAILSEIIRNYVVLPVPNFTPKLATGAVLRSVNGLYVQLQERSVSVQQ